LKLKYLFINRQMNSAQHMLDSLKDISNYSKNIGERYLSSYKKQNNECDEN